MRLSRRSILILPAALAAPSIPKQDSFLSCFFVDHLPANSVLAVYEKAADQPIWVLDSTGDFIQEIRKPRQMVVPPTSCQDLESAAECLLTLASQTPNTHYDLEWDRVIVLGGKKFRVSSPDFVGMMPVWPDGRRGLMLHNPNGVIPCDAL